MMTPTAISHLMLQLLVSTEANALCKPSFLPINSPIRTLDSASDETFLDRSLNVKDKFAYFYITAKIHKIPWKM